MLELRDKFIENGIPYDDIDPEMIELLDVFNFHLGLKTQFCCYGHNHSSPTNRQTEIIFDKSVTDEDIYHLAEQTGGAYLHITFNKWVRYYPVMSNWTMNLGVTYEDQDSPEKKKYTDEVVEVLRNCKPRTT
ncbi:hypothetical protein WKH56_19890 [Priestia sp. SB1]|uniref:hypothetical protein n=1 Tax=Priestia sp. SB1 TaxID=3132359 RepID=UPI0031782DB2